MHSHRTLLVGALLALAGLASVTGCSSSSDAAPETPEDVANQATVAFEYPGTEFQTIDSTLPGVSKWTFYWSDQGNAVVAIGTDTSGTAKAKLAMTSDDDLNVSGTAYEIAEDVAASPSEVLATLDSDSQRQLGDVPTSAMETASTSETSSFHPLDDSSGSLVTPSGSSSGAAAAGSGSSSGSGVGSLVKNYGAGVVTRAKALFMACGSSIARLATAALVQAGTSTAAKAVFLTCPANFGAGCVGGVAIAVLGKQAAQSIACPNMPNTTIIGAGSNVLLGK